MLHYGRIVLLSFLLLGCSLSENNPVDENVLARIEDHKVTETQFVNAFKRNFYKVGQTLQPSLDNKVSVLKEEFETYVLAVHSEDLGIANDERSDLEYGLLQRKVYAEEYLLREVLSKKNVTEADLRELFLRFNSRVRASHLYAKTKEEADRLYERLLAGESFEALAEEVFTNPYLANNGGDIGEFTVDEMDIAFENAAFALNVGDVSAPVKTRQGYSIIKLTDRYSTPILTEFQYQSQKNNLMSLAAQRKEEIETRAFISSTIDRLNIDDELLEELWVEINNDQANSIAHNFEDQTLNFELSNYSNQPISSVEGFSFTVENLKQEGFYTDPTNLANINDFDNFKDFVHGIIFRTYIVDRFRETEHINDPLVRSSIEQSFNVYLSNRVRTHIFDSITFTEDELREEFENNREMYDFPLMVNTGRIVVATEEEALKLKKELEAGADWEQAVINHTLINQDLMVNGEMGLQPIQNYGSYAFDIKDLSVNEITEPLAFEYGQFVLFKVLEIEEPRPSTFEESKGLVERVLKNQQIEERLKATISETMDKHDAVLNIEKLKSIRIEL
ncbi:MAG: peptidylprolyl isomerase [Balneolaceae bacterium]|nr:peptidylprolyl isomerase [Balneolaceae bacterium]